MEFYSGESGQPGHFSEGVCLRRVQPGKQCALLVDQAGWHTSQHLDVPGNVTIVRLPAKCVARQSG